jgi:hypothetical protein
MSKIRNQLAHLFTLASKPSSPRPRSFPSAFRPLTLGLLLSISSLLSACGLDIEDPTPPSPPVWVQKSLPEEWPERGIDAHESGGIYLEWEPNPSEGILAFHIYRAQWFEDIDSLGDYTLVAQIQNETMFGFNYVDLQVGFNQYFYKLKSKDNSENISEFSDSLTYSLLRSIDSEAMIPNGQAIVLPEDRTLRWNYYPGFAMEEYCITILSDENEFVHRAVILPQNYIGRSESWQIPLSIKLESNMVYNWRIDMIARFVDGLETSGSESSWAKFVYSVQ